MVVGPAQHSMPDHWLMASLTHSPRPWIPCTQGTVPSVDVFMQQYHMQCPMAYNRLVQVGLPATIEHRKR